MLRFVRKIFQSINFTKNMAQNKTKKAFSLIELSVVIIIISILISGSLTASISAINNAKNKVTRDRIEQIYKALGNYVLINGKLPCPASLLEIKSTSSNYGVSVGTSGTCSGSGVYNSTIDTNLVYGMVPIRALGLENDMAEDGFESKLSYVVDMNFTGDEFGKNAVATNTMTIMENTGGAEHTNTSDALFVIISHGANRSGAFPINSASQNARGDISEKTNDMMSSFTKIFISKAKNSEVFDDILFYKTRNQLIADFNAFSKIYCLADNLTVSYPASPTTSVIHAFAEAAYDQLVISTVACPDGYKSTTQFPTRRCGALGIWQEFITNPCTE